MNNTRQDAWGQDEDVLLAETVLRYIREGKTQLEAFREVGKRLSRTPAACGFRWNASIRKQYQKAINMAKKDKKQQVDSSLNQFLAIDDKHEEGALDAAISLLEQMKVTYASEQKDNSDNEQLLMLKEEISELKNQIKRYEDAWREMGQLWRLMENDDKNKTLME
ncbi:RsfA family transcriptional regulator [Aquibacillus rhizosphaerae]|uniref:RsfA family transcriptional regulator n=1 Tax=Aquibacillus rhizosphaerae TaxID=3051431 RepID=A0ABT7L5Y7_9BACI|nr:RsfA family transcriptional regulator [Aquibacillus sp. LR5S19]MDL4841276.1 RsfA family transcriptional regulator [Aquibacillus sp. LR5S19]